jgi:hypothetical protein
MPLPPLLPQPQPPLGGAWHVTLPGTHVRDVTATLFGGVVAATDTGSVRAQFLVCLLTFFFVCLFVCLFVFQANPIITHFHPPLSTYAADVSQCDDR